MSGLEERDGGGRSRVPRARLTTAGRLLGAVCESGCVELAEFSKVLQVPVRHLEQCRDGERTLDLDVQILLAAAALTLAPEHTRLARQLHAQAQSALRVREGTVPSHATYQRTSWK